MRELPDWLEGKKWWALVDAGGEEPYPIDQWDMSKPFVYDRKWGVFPVQSGNHFLVMALLYAWHHGFDRLGGQFERYLKESGVEVKGIGFVKKYADVYIETIPGTAFKSSVNKKVVFSGKPSHLTETEKDYLGKIEYICNGR